MELNLDLEDELRLEDDLSIKSMIFLSKSYLESAMIFSKNARLIEFKESLDYYDKSNYNANVVGSILFSVQYVESTINEFFINVADGLNFGSDIKFAKREKLIDYWSADKASSYRILEKYQTALNIMECKQFNESRNPFQNIKSLISLRNYLVHYKPEWVELRENEKDSVRLTNLEKKLIRKFLVRKISGMENEYFPFKYLSYGCTDWAIANCIQFVQVFYNSMSIEDIYKDIIKEIRINYEA